MSSYSSRTSKASPISLLSHDLLCMIFTEARESGRESSLYRYSSWNSTPAVVLSHVCQLWRDLALHHALLWDELIWSFHSRPEPVLAVLTRSKSAPLRIDIEMTTDLDEPQASFECIHAAHTVIRAIAPHLQRTTSIALSWSEEFWNPDVFAQLSWSSACPRLRELRLAYHPREGPIEVDFGHIKCCDLLELHLVSVELEGWTSMLGPSTHAVSLEGIDFSYADISCLLERTPSLAKLRLEGDILCVPRTASRTLVGHAMHLIDILYFGANSLQVLERLIPIDQIHNVTLSTEFADDDLGPWLGFLRFSGSAPSFMQLHTWGKRWCKFSIANDKDSTDFKTRTITTARSVLSRLPPVLQLHGAHFLLTLRTIDVDVMHWAELLDMIACAPLDHSLQVLEEIHLSVDPSLLRIYPHLDLELRDYGGPTISFPQLRVLDIVLLGYDLPSNQLVRRLLRAVHAISFPPHVALRVTYPGQTWQNAAEAQTFVDAFTRILEEIIEVDADSDEVAVSRAFLRGHML